MYCAASPRHDLSSLCGFAAIGFLLGPGFREGSTAVPASMTVEIASAGAQLLTRQPATEKYFATQ
jgi:hypothetical protein